MARRSRSPRANPRAAEGSADLVPLLRSTTITGRRVHWIDDGKGDLRSFLPCTSEDNHLLAALVALDGVLPEWELLPGSRLTQTDLWTIATRGDAALRLRIADLERSGYLRRTTVGDPACPGRPGLPEETTKMLRSALEQLPDADPSRRVIIARLAELESGQHYPNAWKATEPLDLLLEKLRDGDQIALLPGAHSWSNVCPFDLGALLIGPVRVVHSRPSRAHARLLPRQVSDAVGDGGPVNPVLFLPPVKGVSWIAIRGKSHRLQPRLTPWVERLWELWATRGPGAQIEWREVPTTTTGRTRGKKTGPADRNWTRTLQEVGRALGHGFGPVGAGPWQLPRYRCSIPVRLKPEGAPSPRRRSTPAAAKRLVARVRDTRNETGERKARPR